MTNLLRLILAWLALGATVIARAESTPARSAPHRSLGLILAVLDSNQDGILSAQEIRAAPSTLVALDINGDGMISSDERRATHFEGRTARVTRGGAFNVVLTLDANQDGVIQTMEIANAVSSLKRLDSNGDGELTRDELRPLMVGQTRA